MINIYSIVTGAQLILKDHVIYIRIHQSKLLAGGFVSDYNSNWKDCNAPHDNFTLMHENKDTYNATSYKGFEKFKIEYNGDRGLFVNNVILEKNEVVTGLRFIFTEMKGENFINLDVRGTLFDPSTGKLEPEKSYWTSSREGIIKR